MSDIYPYKVLTVIERDLHENATIFYRERSYSLLAFLFAYYFKQVRHLFSTENSFSRCLKRESWLWIQISMNVILWLQDIWTINLYCLIPAAGTAVTAWAGTEGMPLDIPESLFSVRPESLQEPELGEPELRTDDPEGMVLPWWLL
jgi:hypothetical protein